MKTSQYQVFQEPVVPSTLSNRFDQYKPYDFRDAGNADKLQNPVIKTEFTVNMEFHGIYQSLD